MREGVFDKGYKGELELKLWTLIRSPVDPPERQPFNPSISQSINKYLLTVHCAPDTVLGFGGLLGEQQRQNFCPRGPSP